MSGNRTLATQWCLAFLAGVGLGLVPAGRAGAATDSGQAGDATGEQSQEQSQGVVDLRYQPEDEQPEDDGAEEDQAEDDKPLRGLALEKNVTTGLNVGQTVCLAFDAASTEVLAGGTEIHLEGIKKGSVLRVTYLCPGDATIASGDCTCMATKVQVVDVRGIWRHSLTFGAEFSQERGDFSEQDAVLGFSTDTLWAQWGKKDKNRFHSHLEVGLVAVPNEQTSAPAMEGESGPDRQQVPPGNGSGSALETFLASRKSISMQVGGYWVRELRRGDDVLNLGLVGKYGFHSLANQEEVQRADGLAAATEDTVKSFYAAGFRFAHHKQVPPGVNPETLRSVEVLVGHYENFLSKTELAALGVENPKEQRLRVVIDGRLRLPGKMPVYTGILANLGEGKDDVRLFVALRFDIEKLAALLPKP